MFPDPFLPRVAVRVGKGSGYSRLLGCIDIDSAGIIIRYTAAETGFVRVERS